MAIREGKWRCPSCDSVNLGRDMKCNACGTVRGEDVEFFLEEEAEAVTDQNLTDMAKAGTDWHCDFCGTDNRAGTQVCRQCGAPAEGMKRRQQKMQGNAASDAPAPPQTSGAKKNPLKFIIPAVAAVVAVVLVLFLASGKKDSLQLEGGSWNRIIEVEHEEWVEHEAWRDQVPRGAVVLRTWEAQRSTEKVQVGTETVKTGTKDMGNGFFEDVYEERPVYEEHPVYDEKVEYKIEEWVVYRDVRVSGDYDDPLSWPDPALKSGDREGQRKESAELIFSSTDPENEGAQYRYSLAPDEISQFHKGENYQAVVSGDKVRRFLDED